MKKLSLSLFVIFVVFFGFVAMRKDDFSKLHEGDLIFQTSLSSQSKAIQLATKSKYSHCGILFRENGRWFVFEAIQPVKKTTLESWIKRGQNKKYVVKRLKDESVLNADVLRKMQLVGKTMIGKNYDLGFGWSDDKIYCSELIWKIYKRGAGIEIGKLQKLRDFDLSDATVKSILKARYGNKIPLDETVISPVSIFESGNLKTVLSK
ncbi:YiiX family permuted papain-like enzyme [Flavobacterium sp.]|uniref:YiiX family permuted papain-like enzyme n=1 Tax=Flavobacterium sp. TaxID=239 RepID=UPI00121ADEA0|nr:YiiX family permuted papain-like enzyme [Flavobacterium sp.]RZJ72383.1 MAG: YiiX family permuted papain-like enzyme [Flavobacterium sp.]